MNRRTSIPAAALALAAISAFAVLGGGSCSKTPDTPGNAKAFRVTDRSQLIGGPTALGDVGDYMLENGEVRVLVQDKVFNRGAGVFGGSLIDADLARATNEGGALGGSGNDSFGEMFPAFFLEMIDPDTVEVVNDGSNGEAAIVEVRGRGGEFITMLRYLNQLLLSTYKDPTELLSNVLSPKGIAPDSDTDPNIEFTTRYILEPGVHHVRIESTMRNISTRTLEMPPQQVLDLLAGLAGLDLGAFRIPTGHVLGFGKLSEIFLPGLGYDIALGLRDAGKEPIDLPGFPGFRTPIVASTNSHGVNYGFAMEDNPDTAFVYQLDQDGIYGGTAQTDDMLYLFNASGFGGVFTARAPRTLAPSFCGEGLDPQATCEKEFEGDRIDACVAGWDACVTAQKDADSEFTYTNYLLIGDGDAASLWEEYYRIRDMKVQKVRGRVVDDTSSAPVPAKESVLIYQDNAASCALGKIYNQVYTVAGGRFELDLPPGKYCARSMSPGRPLGDFKKFTVTDSKGVYLEIMAHARGHIMARVAGTDGVPLPSKMTVVGVHEYHENPDYRSFLMDEVAGESHRPTDLVPDDPNDPMTRRYIEDMAYGGADGLIELDVRPGKYTVFFSRGVEYGIESKDIDVKPGGTVRVSATLPRLLDTTGYVSGDFHMHQAGSIDSGLDFNTRVKSVAAEGVEVVVATEHNYITDLSPYVYRNKLNPWLHSVIGIELTTFEAGHFNGFPVDRTLRSMNRGSFAWQDIAPDRIFAEMRDMAPPGMDSIVQVNHPRTPIMGYFEQHNLNPFSSSVELPINEAPPGLAGLGSKLASPNGSAFIETFETADGGTEYRSTFSWDFDAIEIFNGPHFEELRHYRMPYDKNAAAGQPDAVPEATRAGLTATLVEDAGMKLDATLADYQTERDGTAVTEDDVTALSEADHKALVDDWVQSQLPEQWSVLCDGNDIVQAGSLDDWYNTLNYPRPDGTYKKYTATGNSDSHSAHLDPPGLPRNFFFVGHDDPESVTDQELVTALQHHHNIVSNGPFVDFTVDGSEIGSELKASGSVSIDVTIRAVPWVGADRFRIVANGEVVRGLDPAQDEGFWGWVPISLDDKGEFHHTYNVDTGDKDTWYVVEVEADKSMFPVIEPQDIPPFNFSDVIGGLASAFGFGATVPGLGPDYVFPLHGFAFTNPIWVIADGDGEFTPPSPPVFSCKDGVYMPADSAPNALIDSDALIRASHGRLRATALPRLSPKPSPLKRPRGENRDLRIIFEAWGHRH